MGKDDNEENYPKVKLKSKVSHGESSAVLYPLSSLIYTIQYFYTVHALLGVRPHKIAVISSWGWQLCRAYSAQSLCLLRN